MVNLDQIETFVEVVKLGGFAKAARSLSIPTSTVTARVKALENRLGVGLLQRTTRSVALSPEGEIYYSKCREGLVIFSDAEDAVSDATLPKGVVRISVPTAYPMAELSNDIASFNLKFPEVYFDVDVSDGLIDFVQDGFDLALRGGAVGRDGHIARRISDTPVAFFSTPAFWARHGMSHTVVEEPVSFPVIGPQALLRQVKSNNCIRALIHTESFELSRSFAVSGASAALLPVSVFLEDENSGRVMRKCFATRSLSLPLYLVFPGRRNTPVRARVFADHLIARRKALD